MLALSGCGIVVHSNFDDCIDYCIKYNNKINRSCETQNVVVDNNVIEVVKLAINCREIEKEQCYHECLLQDE